MRHLDSFHGTPADLCYRHTRRIEGFCRGTVVTWQVDPEALRAFANFVANTAEAIGERDVGEPYATSQSALPGTDFDAVCARAFAATEQALDNVRSRLLEVVDITDGAKNDYVTAEADFVAALSVMDQSDQRLSRLKGRRFPAQIAPEPPPEGGGPQ